MSAETGSLLFGSEAVHIDPRGEISRQIQQIRYGRELWRLCLVLGFILLVAESLIARGREIA